MSSFLANSARTIVSFGKVLFLSKKSGILKPNPVLKHSHCVILGNGPSLNDTLKKYGDQLQYSELVGVNSMVTSDLYVQLKPRFYMLNAPVYFYADNQISQLYIDLKHSIFDSFRVKTTWEIFLMVPFMAKKSVDFQKLLKDQPNIHPLYFNQTAVEGYTWFQNLCYAKGWGMPRPHNVLIPSIMCIIKLGFKEIYITGADHSWLGQITVNDKNEALVNHQHFYAAKESGAMRMHDWAERPRRLHEIIHKFYLSFKGYWDILEFASKKGIRIYNASEVSMIDAFERKNINFKS